MTSPKDRWVAAVAREQRILWLEAAVRDAKEREREILRLQEAMRVAQTDEAHTEAESALYAYLESLEEQDAAELEKLGYRQK
jgi:hypothetical protein